MAGTKRHWPQYLIAFQSWIASFLFGFHIGWTSSFQTLLQSEQNPLSGPPVTDDEISWMAALPSLSLIIGTPIYGYFTDKLGRKLSTLLAFIPFLVAHIMLIFAKSVPIVYVARLLAGFGASGGLAVFPIYIAETCTEERRGLLTSLGGPWLNSAIMISFGLGGWTSYQTTNVTLLCVTSIYFFFYFWLPESPVYEKNIEKRLQIVKKLRGTDPESITKELSRIQKLLETNNENFNFFKLFTDRSNWRSMIIVNGIWGLGMTCGYPAILRYTVDIFQKTGSQISPFLSAIILTGSQLICALVGSCLMDKIGRKLLLIYSTVIMTAGLAAFTLYLYIRPETVSGSVAYVPVITLTIFASGYSLGYLSVPCVMVTDLFSPNSRASAMAFGSLLVAFNEFLVTKMYPGMTSWLTMEGTFTVFVGSGVAGFVFILLFVVETKEFLLERGTKDEDPDFKLMNTNVKMGGDSNGC